MLVAEVEIAMRVVVFLKTTADQNLRAVLKDINRAIAVVHIKVDDGDPLYTGICQCGFRCDGDIVKQAEAHRSCQFGMMARRPHGTECTVGASPQDIQYSLSASASG